MKVKLRILLIQILVLNFVIMYGQVGKYCWDEGMMNMCFTFKENNSFEYLHHMSVAIEEGKGFYKITNDTITLDYEPMPFFLERYSVEKIGELRDQIKLNIEVVDFDAKIRIIKYELQYYSEQDFENMDERILLGNLYNEVELINNSCSIQYNGSNVLFSLSSNVANKDYSNAMFSIEKPGIYNVNVKLKQRRGSSLYVMIEGSVSYEMILKNDSLILKDINSEVELILKKK